METKSLDENQRGPAEARLCAMQPARKVLCKKAEDGGAQARERWDCGEGCREAK